MSVLDFVPKGDIWTGVAVGVGLAAAPAIIPLAGAGATAVLKMAFMGAFMVYEGASTVCEKAREFGTEMVEGASNLVEEAASEARSELAAREN